MTQTFKVRATVSVVYEYEVMGDTIEEVVEFVEDGEAEDECVEIDSSMPTVTEYTIEGQMGWNPWPTKSWFTVWVSEAHGHGTHFVQAFLADDIEDAKAQAAAECMACWDHLADEVAILGVCEGDVRVIEWNEENA